MEKKIVTAPKDMGMSCCLCKKEIKAAQQYSINAPSWGFEFAHETCEKENA